MYHDSDPYCRWDAGQRLARLEILDTLNVLTTSCEPMISESFLRAFSQVLDVKSEDQAFQALTLTLPEEAYLTEDLAVIDPVLLHRARAATEHALAQYLEERLTTQYHSLTTTAPYVRDSHSVGNRALRNLCLTYLMKLESDNVFALATQQLSTADNMTDALAALSALASSHAPRREKILGDFFQKWQSYPLVVDKWLRVQATSTRHDTLKKVRELTEHVAYDSDNPNNIYALIGGFSFSNPLNFHQIDGAGYRFLADQVIRLDRSNPQLAARLVGALSHWRRYEPIRQQLMREQLQRVLSAPQVSRDVAEIGTRTLATS
jgi:aminopeptidase N